MYKNMIVLLFTVLGVAMSLPDVLAAQAGPARAQLDRFTTGLHSLQADFTQVIKSQDGRIQDQSSGKIWLQNPDKLRWEYGGEFPEIIVADGSKIWIYDEALQQVTVKPQSNQVSDAPLMVLMDSSKLDAQFIVTEVGDFEGMQLLELKSLGDEPEFERVLLGLSSDGIQMMTLEDAFGQRTEIRFSNMLRNTEIDASMFSFTPPDDADVVGEVPALD